jgi:hypothetical protein
MPIVDLLEVLEIEHEEDLVTRCLLCGRVKRGIEEASIGDACP